MIYQKHQSDFMLCRIPPDVVVGRRLSTPARDGIRNAGTGGHTCHSSAGSNDHIPPMHFHCVEGRSNACTSLWCCLADDPNLTLSHHSQIDLRDSCSIRSTRFSRSPRMNVDILSPTPNCAPRSQTLLFSPKTLLLLFLAR